MRLAIAAVALAACSAPAVRHPRAALRASKLDVVLDIDQPREQVPDGDWTQRRYVGPKRYDRLFVDIVNEAPAAVPPRGPLGDVATIEVWGGAQLLATLPRAELGYTAEDRNDFADDLGEHSYTREHMRFFLGAAAGSYVASTYPFHVALRARTSTGALVVELHLTGDESTAYAAITPPRPY